MKRKYNQSIIILLTLLTVACQSSNEKSNINPAAYSPAAEAGADQTVSQGDTVVLDGSRSSDPNGAIVTYLWEQTGGTAVGFRSSAIQISFTAPQPAGTSEALTFLLTVTDDSGNTSSDTVTVTVYAVWANLPPSAQAGADQTVSEGNTVTLDGTGSTDPDGSIVSYLWEQTAGTAVDFDHSSVQPGFTAPQPAGASEALTFLLTVTDDSGDTASDSVTVTVTALAMPEFSDDFTTDSRSDYTVTHVLTNGGNGQFLYDATGERLRIITGDNVALRFDHATPIATENGILQMDLLPTATYPNGGEIIIWLMQDDRNYYVIDNTDGYGPRTISKVVDGVVVDSAAFSAEYGQNTMDQLTVTFTPDTFSVNAFGDLLSLTADSTAIFVEEFRVQLAQQDAYIDNIFFSNDISLLNYAPTARFQSRIEQPLTVIFNASASFDLDGSIVQYNWDFGDGELASGQIVSHVYTSTGSYMVELTVTDDDGSDNATSMNIQNATDYYVAFGDSITRGSHDDILSDGIGYEPILETLLDGHKSYPSLVYNEGVSGETSSEGLDRLPAILDDHPYARYYLVMYGANDASAPSLPSGLGLLQGDTGYEGSYKDNMQTMIAAIINRGKIPYLAKLPYTIGVYAALRPPIEEYNDVIEELSIENGIDVIPPDFYCLFESHPERLADGLHPDGLGYQLMAQWWFDALTGVEHEECY